MWNVGIYDLITGVPQLEVPVSAGSWETRLSGRGRGQHTIPLYGAGIPQALILELKKGNKYVIVQRWGTHVVYAGVIQRPRYRPATHALTIDSVELRAAYMNSRMLYGVNIYDSTGTILTVTSKSHSGAARAVVDAGMPNPDWVLPIDLPSDGSGSFSATWLYNERLKWEDHLAQIEADGCEIDFRPYLDGDGLLRWETRVDTKIAVDPATDLAVGAPDSPVLDLEVGFDYAKQMTGVLGFGKGGMSAYAITVGGLDISVRDVWLNWPDIDDPTRLQAAVDASFAELNTPTEQWSFGLHVFPNGPEFTAPGRLLNLWVYGDEFIPDGKHAKRVVALRGDMGTTVTPEVQDAA